MALSTADFNSLPLHKNRTNIRMHETVISKFNSPNVPKATRSVAPDCKPEQIQSAEFK